MSPGARRRTGRCSAIAVSCAASRYCQDDAFTGGSRIRIPQYSRRIDMNRVSFVAALGFVACASAAPLSAQRIGGTPVQFGVMGGATKPVGDVAAYTQHDWSLGALVSIGSPQSRFNFRADGQWQQLAGVR